jgi:ArsR family metal-binding transcriptional regulator
METTTYKACTDCTPIIANGDATHLDIHDEETADQRLKEIEESIQATQERDGVELSIGSTDNYEGFSSTACEICGDKHAGERIEVIGIKNK